ncbi:hypothetical protein BKA64DRAFT_687360, partial [Cadophora sp. MPI-SDFR-AT-0126]
MLAKNFLAVVALALATAAMANPLEKRWQTQDCCCPGSGTGVLGTVCVALVGSTCSPGTTRCQCASLLDQLVCAVLV